MPIQLLASLTQCIHTLGHEVVDDNGVNIIFDVADGISGYTPTLYTEVLDDNNFRQEVRGSQSNSLPIHRSTQWSHRPNERDPSKQQYLSDDTCFAYDMHDDSTIFEQHNDYVEHDSAFDNNLGDDDEVSQSSEEDVDEGLEAEDREEHEIPEFETPSSMFTDDTWTNIVDPSPQMPNKSHVGWDGHCELFKGQFTPYISPTRRLTPNTIVLQALPLLPTISGVDFAEVDSARGMTMLGAGDGGLEGGSEFVAGKRWSCQRCVVRTVYVKE
ncbi:hypothetical protein RHSIM_RhsimUnG0202500 [Rhododendron simsii]|uniref:Uncharacterized protein n=1 Tax=Rhododendron simsii TaxID=118357 RepID=A0A834L453_RHOSS|nr:hypothetical protein RHSIM_RhsimUnG0202500 [Rhododendron simsii]